MGTLGTGISSNDTYADVYDAFFDLYNDGISVVKISEKLIKDNQETINISEDANNFWFALANAQWECKELDKEIFQKVKEIIESENDLEIWKELDASDSDIKLRKVVLEKFLIKLESEKANPKKRKKKKLYDSIFKKGDCLTFIMDNGNYGGAFVLTDEIQTNVGVNFIALTNIDQIEKPKLAQFKKADVYIKRFKDKKLVDTIFVDNWIEQPQIGMFMACNFKKENTNIEIIGSLKIYNDYKIGNSFLGFGWNILFTDIPYKNNYTKINGEAHTKIKLSKWVKMFPFFDFFLKT